MVRLRYAKLAPLLCTCAGTVEAGAVLWRQRHLNAVHKSITLQYVNDTVNTE